MIYQTNWLKMLWRFHWKWRSNWNWISDGRLKISLKMKISHFQLPSEPPKLPAGDQRTWILEVDCFPLLRPGNVERKKECWRWRRFWVRRGSEIHMVWKGEGWINCMMERSPASALLGWVISTRGVQTFGSWFPNQVYWTWLSTVEEGCHHIGLKQLCL